MNNGTISSSFFLWLQTLGYMTRVGVRGQYLGQLLKFKKCRYLNAGPRRAVGNVSGYRCVSDCRSRGREFDPGLVPYFRGD